jgi:hypothetical protein
MSNHKSGIKTLNLGDVGDRLSDVFTHAIVRHRPVSIARGGKDLAAARLDLLDEVRDYMLKYLEEIDSYRAAPNRRAYFPHVIKALAADLSGHLDSVIFADRPTA